MLAKWISVLMSFFSSASDSNKSEAEPRRKNVRHGGFQAEVTFANRAYSVRDWSLGGVAFDTAPDASLMVGDKLNVVFKFRFANETITVQQPVHVVRAQRRSIAAQFGPIVPEARRQFDRVLDYLHMEKFLESQAA